MADETQSAATAEESAPGRPPKYDAAGWRERARSEFGRSPHVIAGALHDVPAGQEVTKTDVKRAIAQWDRIEEEPDGDPEA